MKKNTKKLNIKRIILLVAILFSLHIYMSYHSSINQYIMILQKNSTYKIIKENTNKNYNGIGQEQIDHKDGYFTTFTTGEKYKKTYIEYKQNGNSSWSNHDYWGGTMADNGCGITALSIILSGYHKNYTPEDLRKKYYPVFNYEDFPEELSSTFGIKNTDFFYDSIHLSKKSIKEHLESNRPIVICVWTNSGNNRWTNKSHYMVLLATDGNSKVYISNPNGLENDIKSSGWYDFDEVIPYVAKALYIESY